MVVLDYSSSLSHLSDLKSATLDGGAAIEVSRRSLTYSEASPSEGVHQLREGVYWLPYTSEPKIGSSLIVEGITFIVQSVEPPTHKNFWVAHVREVSIETAGITVHDRITRYPAVQSIGRYGQRISNHPSFDVDFREVPCRIQPEPTSQVDTLGRRTRKRVYNITVSKDCGELKHGDVLKDSRGKVYDIVSVQNRKRLDELSLIVTESTD